MTKPISRKPKQLEHVKQKTLNAYETKTRVHAIVGQVIDELQDRRAKGQSDYVATLADEVEQSGLAGWKALKELLPRDEIETTGGGANVKFGPLFAMVVQRMSERERYERQAATAAPSEKIINVPVIHELDPLRPEEAIETKVEEDDGRSAFEW
jgi:hypothetical protein